MTTDQKLGFESVRSSVAALCSSAMGRERCAAMSFSPSAPVVHTLLRQTAEMLAIVGTESGFPLGQINDRRTLLAGLDLIRNHFFSPFLKM